jgi:hypothetical protein
MVKILLDGISINKIIEIIECKDNSLPRTKAIGLLSKFDYPGKERYLQSILEDESEEEDARVIAISTLSRIPTQESIDILTESLYFQNIIENKRLLRNILKGLTKIGDAKALSAIQSISITDNLSDLAKFAVGIISYRHQIPGNNFNVESHIHKVEKFEHELKISQIKDIENFLPLNTQYGIKLNKETGYKITFGNEIKDKIVLFNDNFFLRHTNLNKKNIIGVILTSDIEYHEYEVEYLITSTLSIKENKNDILIVRVDGKIHYTGFYQIISHDEIEFSINSCDQKDVLPLIIEGKLKEGNLIITKSGYSRELKNNM